MKIDTTIHSSLNEVPTYTLYVDRSNVDEGETVVFYLDTTNVPVDTRVPFGISGSIRGTDVPGGQLPDAAFYVGTDGTATLAIGFVTDGITEGAETFTITLMRDPSKRATVTVNDPGGSLTPNHLPAGSVTIHGTPNQGQTLTAANSLTDTDGLGGIFYQWQANGNDIGVGKTYLLTTQEVGKTVTVMASYTDGHGTVESVTSPATSTVSVFSPSTVGNDRLLGTGGDDVMNGLAGNDTILGYSGNDTLLGDIGNDLLDGGVGKDRLSGGSGADTLQGGSGNDSLDGGIGNDHLEGGASNDTLNGGNGFDTMLGGDGNDHYVVDNLRDIIDEGSDRLAGIDSVESSVSYTLGNNLERLNLTGLNNLSGIGNDGTNIIVGNSGDNLLSGMNGNDTLKGSLGDDTLLGGGGVDQLVGGDGSDTYQISSTEDIIIETPKDGDQDVVETSISYDLGNNLEVLRLIGVNNINGSGNDLNNLMDGNNANNLLEGNGGADDIQGNEGNDTLDGGVGNDTLDGGEGNDVAQYGYDLSDYKITFDSDSNTWTVQDVNGLHDLYEGKDLIRNVEILAFADQDFSTNQDVGHALIHLLGITNRLNVGLEGN